MREQPLRRLSPQRRPWGVRGGRHRTTQRTGARMDTLELVGLIIIVILLVVSYLLPDDED